MIMTMIMTGCSAGPHLHDVHDPHMSPDIRVVHGNADKWELAGLLEQKTIIGIYCSRKRWYIYGAFLNTFYWIPAQLVFRVILVINFTLMMADTELDSSYRGYLIFCAWYETYQLPCRLQTSHPPPQLDTGGISEDTFPGTIILMSWIFPIRAERQVPRPRPQPLVTTHCTHPPHLPFSISIASTAPAPARHALQM